jgi:hypothetical protein
MLKYQSDQIVFAYDEKDMIHMMKKLIRGIQNMGS